MELSEFDMLNTATVVTNADTQKGVKDEYGVLYSFDGKKLLRGANVENYSIMPGTIVICNTAFWDCNKLHSIIIPSTVKAIGVNAFLRCSSLVSITIPSSVISIMDSAFFGCINLTSILIPSSVVAIGDGAFEVIDPSIESRCSRYSRSSR